MVLKISQIGNRLFGIHPDEFKLVQLFLLYYTCVGMFYTFAVTTGDALFLVNIDAGDIESMLAWVYVGVALSSVLVIWAYHAVSPKMSRIRLFLGIQLFLLITLVFFRFVMDHTPPAFSEWFYFVLIIWLEMCGFLSITLFFSFSGDYFTSHSAKRLYGYRGDVTV